MKLLCDEMLKGLARWLRAAGHDTELAHDGEADRDLIARARQAERLLLTRDRKLLEHRGADQTVCLLDCNGLESCVQALTEQTDINWLHAPFTRCLVCNIPLVPMETNQELNVPDDVRDGPLLRCPECERIYWEGSHVKRMLAKLQKWAGKTPDQQNGV